MQDFMKNKLIAQVSGSAGFISRKDITGNDLIYPSISSTENFLSLSNAGTLPTIMLVAIPREITIFNKLRWAISISHFDYLHANQYELSLKLGEVRLKHGKI